jgi:uncharacterized protein YebE (UPF0316 family)
MFDEPFSQTAIFRWGLLPLMIAISRMTDVTLGTLRHIFIARGMRGIVPFLGFFEVLIWLITMGWIMKNLDNFMCYIGWAGGFAAGTYIGMLVEERLAIGIQVIRIITNKECGGLIGALREKNIGLTVIDGQGAKSPVKILFTIVERKDVQDVATMVNQYNPGAFYSVEDIRMAKQGVFPSAVSGTGKFDYFRRIFPSGKMK